MESDNFYEDEEFDLALAKLIAESESGVFVLNPQRVKDMEAVYKMIVNAIEGDEVKISVTRNEPFTTMGTISLEGENIFFSKLTGLSDALGRISNIEIYPKTDGTVVVDMTFHGLAKKV